MTFEPYFRQFHIHNNMDPEQAGSSKSSGAGEVIVISDEEEEPFLVKVIVKMFKVVNKNDQDDKGPSKKHLNTKTYKVEAELRKTDFHSKLKLVNAIEKAADIKEMAKAESIQNPKSELSVMRKETSEVYTVTNHMGIVNRRLDKLINKEDSFLVEVKEEVLLFQPNCPTIKIMINQEKVIRNEAAGRSLKPKVRRDLNLALKELSGSSYNGDIKRITCGKCKSGVKPRLVGAARSIFNYFKGIYIAVVG